MNVLGIDPDTKTVGLGLVKEIEGSYRPIYARLVSVVNRRAPVGERISELIERLSASLDHLRYQQPEATANDFQIVIESQRYRPGTSVRAQDLIHLAQVAGACAGICRTLWANAEIMLVEPAVWKGTVPKAVFTKRILKILGLKVDARGGFAFPWSKAGLRLPGSHGIAKKDATHAIDALGLAHWRCKKGRDHGRRTV